MFKVWDIQLLIDQKNSVGYLNLALLIKPLQGIIKLEHK